MFDSVSFVSCRCFCPHFVARFCEIVWRTDRPALDILAPLVFLTFLADLLLAIIVVLAFLFVLMGPFVLLAFRGFAFGVLLGVLLAFGLPRPCLRRRPLVASKMFRYSCGRLSFRAP